MLCRTASSEPPLHWRPKRSAGGLVGTAWGAQIEKWMSHFQIADPAIEKPLSPPLFLPKTEVK